jgi:hypothetical protein
MGTFHVPDGHPNFLFALPAVLVAKADGEMSEEELFQLMWSSYLSTFLDNENAPADEHSFERFLIDSVPRAIPANIPLLRKALAALLAHHAPQDQQRIAAWIRGVCNRVAKASGTSIFRRVSTAEREMLDSIFDALKG